MKKKLILMSMLVANGPAFATVTSDQITTALAKYCVPKQNDVYVGVNVCGSAFEGKYEEGKTCGCQTDGMVYDSSLRHCICSYGYYLSNTGACSKCPDGEYSDAGSIRCSSTFYLFESYTTPGNYTTTLPAGVYKVYVHGGTGGNGGGTGECRQFRTHAFGGCTKWTDCVGGASGGKGGSGYLKSTIINVSSLTEYSLTVGANGSTGTKATSYQCDNEYHSVDGNDCTCNFILGVSGQSHIIKNSGGTGGTGGTSSFSNIISASGGLGGTGGKCDISGSYHCGINTSISFSGKQLIVNGSSGTSYSNSTADGFVKIYKLEDTTKQAPSNTRADAVEK
ncbi:MAG: hypothetical protein K6F04_02625 [bacterium]|nr:hypothetical protein [bacterium]